jgi:hypothetical protein
MDTRTASEILYDARSEYQREVYAGAGPNDLRSLKIKLLAADRTLQASQQMVRVHLWRKQAIEEQIVVRKMRDEEDEASLSAIEELLDRVERFISKTYTWPGVHVAAEKVRALMNMPDNPYGRK